MRRLRGSRLTRCNPDQKITLKIRISRTISSPRIEVTWLMPVQSLLYQEYSTSASPFEIQGCRMQRKHFLLPQGRLAYDSEMWPKFMETLVISPYSAVAYVRPIALI